MYICGIYITPMTTTFNRTWTRNDSFYKNRVSHHGACLYAAGLWLYIQALVIRAAAFVPQVLVDP